MKRYHKPGRWAAVVEAVWIGLLALVILAAFLGLGALIAGSEAKAGDCHTAPVRKQAVVVQRVNAHHGHVLQQVNHHQVYDVHAVKQVVKPITYFAVGEYVRQEAREEIIAERVTAKLLERLGQLSAQQADCPPCDQPARPSGPTPARPSPAGPAGGLEAQVLAVVGAKCASCHRNQGVRDLSDVSVLRELACEASLRVMLPASHGKHMPTSGSLSDAEVLLFQEYAAGLIP